MKVNYAQQQFREYTNYFFCLAPKHIWTASTKQTEAAVSKNQGLCKEKATVCP